MIGPGNGEPSETLGAVYIGLDLSDKIRVQKWLFAIQC